VGQTDGWTVAYYMYRFSKLLDVSEFLYRGNSLHKLRIVLKTRIFKSYVHLLV
jgi:hypothetical protein